MVRSNPPALCRFETSSVDFVGNSNSTLRRHAKRASGASEVASHPCCHPHTHHHYAPLEDGKMAAPPAQVTHASSYYGSEVEVDADSIASMSDYGSEFDATEIDEDTLLASTLASFTQSIPRSRDKSSVLPSIEFEEGEVEDEDHDDLVVVHKPSLLRVAKGDRRSAAKAEVRRDIQSSPVRQTLEVEYDERSRRAWSGA
jgi:exonuclease V